MNILTPATSSMEGQLMVSPPFPNLDGGFSFRVIQDGEVILMQPLRDTEGAVFEVQEDGKIVVWNKVK